MNTLEQLVKAYKEASTLPEGLPGCSSRQEEQAYYLNEIREYATENNISKEVVKAMMKK